MSWRAALLGVILLLVIGAVIPITSDIKAQGTEGGLNLGVKENDGFSEDANYREHAPIRIDNDTDFDQQAEEEGWKGKGTSENPYVIEGYEIDGTNNGSCIYISHTTKYFAIRNCLLYNESRGRETNYRYDAGLHLSSVQNGKIVNNTILNNQGNGAFLKACDHITLAANNISSNNREGIKLAKSNMNRIKDNFISSNYNPITQVKTAASISLKSSNYNKFIGNIILESGVGLRIKSSNNNSVKKNIISNNSMIGMEIRSSGGNEIFKNKVSFNDGFGIEVQNSANNRIEDNDVSNNEICGIYIKGTSRSNIIKNNIGSVYSDVVRDDFDLWIKIFVAISVPGGLAVGYFGLMDWYQERSDKD